MLARICHRWLRRANIAALTEDEARRRNIAKLPVLLGKARPDFEADSNLSDERHEAEEHYAEGYTIEGRQTGAHREQTVWVGGNSQPGMGLPALTA
jgi:hypothetical protein